jgi:protein-L-isoaspartate(D-aspartate) O-methyltransferase
MAAARERLIHTLRRHVDDERVLAAMADVPRDLFVPPELRADAWENVPLPIGAGQTISQPLVVARMCELLELTGDETVLDVGTGSGYHAAVLARLVRHVYSIEVHASLSRAAAESLRAAGVENVTLEVGDGRRGLPQHAPFEAINVAAAAGGAIPPELAAQLAPGGRLVAPVETGDQRLVVARRTPEGVTLTELERVRFVPLVGGS